MRIGIVGAGRIGGGIARRLSMAGHEVRLTFSRDPRNLQRLAAELGHGITVGTPAETAAFADVLVLSVPWPVIPDAIEQLGPLTGTIVIDTTNQYGHPQPPPGQTAAHFNATRLAGARYTKSFNTLTANFQTQAAGRTGTDRVVQWLCGNDQAAKTTAATLIHDTGFVPVDIGDNDAAQIMEPPRRHGAVYGEEYHATDAQAVLDALRPGT